MGHPMTKGTHRISIDYLDNPSETYIFTKKFTSELVRAFPDSGICIKGEDIEKLIVTININSEEMLGEVQEIVDQWGLDLEAPLMPNNIIVFRPFEDVA